MRIKHTEKISLSISILLFVVLFYFFSSLDYKHKSDKTSYQRFTSKIKSGVTYFIFEKELSVMPGDFLHLYSPDNELVEKYEVESIAVPSRQEITLHTTGQSFTGTTRQELSIEKRWEKSTGVVSLRDGRETLQVKISDIDKINGKLWLRINANLDTLNSQKTKISFYQKIQSNEGIDSSFERVKWTSTSVDANQTLYDMFTPPIIYIHDGELTTKLPEKKAIVEEIQRRDLNCLDIPGILSVRHGIFAWSTDALQCLKNAEIIEHLAKLNYITESINPSVADLNLHTLNKHFLRKNGSDSYYGQ